MVQARAVAVALFVFAAPLLAFEKKVSLEARTLSVGNLVGAIEVGPSTTGKFEVAVSVEGKDATPELVQVEVTEGDSARLEVAFPVDSHKTYVYPKLGAGSRSTFSLRDGDASWLSGWFGMGKTIKVVGSGRGIEIWANVKVGVPDGGHLVVRHGAGEATAIGVDGQVDLAVSSGQVTVARIHGDVTVDTGSGHVEARSVDGNLSVDTGSGRVVLDQCRGNKIEVDTGSGRVEARGLEAHHIAIDTGSGGVEAGEIEADSVSIDTGSGGVEIDFARVGAGPFKVDTGSGGIQLSVPPTASIAVRADTGSGSIDVDLAEANFSRRESDAVAFSSGSGAAPFELSTGSGSIRIRPRS
jgi:hypothetical protein